MSDQQPFPPAPVPAQTQQPKRSNPLGLTALIIGIVAIVGCAIPIVNFVSIFLGIVALILGIIGLVQKGRTRGLAIAGAILGAIALIVGISTAAVYGSIANSVSKSLSTAAPLPTSDAGSSAPSDEASSATGDTAAGTRTVHYEVTSDGKTIGSVTYLTVNDNKSASAQEQNVAAPWSKDISIKDSGLFTSSVFSLVAQADANATTITCKITADGKTIQEATSTGPYAVATCSGSAG